MQEDFSYLGSGIVLIREWNTNARFDEIGNTSVFSINPETNTIQLPDYQNPGGGIQSRVDRVTDYVLNMTFHSLNSANLARHLRGSASTVSAGSIAAEPHFAYRGAYVPLKYPALAVASVEPAGGGTPYVVGDDYIVDRGMLYIPATSAITNATSAANIEVDYSHAEIGHVEAGTTAQKFYEVQLHASNEARSGKRVNAVCHRVSGGMLESLSLLGDEFVGMSVAGSLTADASKALTAAHSRYFYWNQEA